MEDLREKRAQRLGIELMAADRRWEEQASTHLGPTAEEMSPMEAQASIAISLKRIADQLDGSAEGVSLYDYARFNHDRSFNG